MVIKNKQVRASVEKMGSVIKGDKKEATFTKQDMKNILKVVFDEMHKSFEVRVKIMRMEMYGLKRQALSAFKKKK